MKSIIKRTLLLSAVACLLAVAPRALAEDGGYLFVTFKGESPTGEQLYFALSRDGRNWTALNNAKPVLVSGIGEKGVRDPYLLRTQDGKFILLATDLSIYWKRQAVGNGPETWRQVVEVGSKSLVIWESSDLVHWEGPRLAAVAPEDAGCAWAPEAIYDPETQDYLVFWASTIKANNYKKHRIFSSRTKDFRTFTPAEAFIDRDTGTIDTTIVRDGETYYRFSKDETRKEIVMESSARLAGPWQEVPGFSQPKEDGSLEGPECYLLNSKESGGQKTWCLIMDAYAKSIGYQPYLTHDLSKAEFTKGEGFSFPFKFRHGSVLPISEAEYTNLEKALGSGK